ncbi:MAG TPA: hypothetical protein QGF35_08230 [Dehalococcoidia bacterium]|nr:hypothetical protein [Dehalococcoidia bacterium]
MIVGGVLIPLDLKWVRVDPLVAANIFVTRITGVMGFIFFLGPRTIVVDWIN